MDLKQLETLTVSRPAEVARKFTFNMVQLGLSTTPRTLLYGYDCDRNSYHLYIDASTGEVILYIYDTRDLKEVTNVTADGIFAYSELVPDKRLYPQYCDYEFCMFLRAHGVYLPFTDYNEPTPDRLVYAGELV
jgi:hypothetical protein